MSAYTRRRDGNYIYVCIFQMYEWGTTRELYDRCTTNQIDEDNYVIHEYIMGRCRRELDCTKKLSDRERLGHAIHKESSLKNDPISVTHPGRARRQLITRTFVAAPNLAGGECPVLEESRLQTGTMHRRLSPSEVAKVRQITAEVDFNRFDPVVKMPKVGHIVSPWTPGGDNSRELFYSSVRSNYDKGQKGLVIA